MNLFLQAIQQFHKKFSSFSQSEPTSKIPEDIKQFRIELMKEELAELVEAMEKENIEEISKELADVMYTVLGTVETYGLTKNFEAIFQAVHDSNMSKDVVKDGKAVKGKNYKEPKIDKILT